MTPARLRQYARDPVTFIDDLIRVNELGRPFKLPAHQRTICKLAFRFDRSGRLPWNAVLYSAPKKSGKTTLNAALLVWWAYTQESPNEIYICANDLDQALGRVFKTACRLIEKNPALARSAEITAKDLRLSNGTVITALPSDYAGAAGSNHGLTSWDELWAYTSESSLRLWDELAPVPTRKNSLRFVTTYAGWEGESKLLWDLYKTGVGPDEHPDGHGERLHPTLPIYGNRETRVFVYWDHASRMPWQTPKYLDARRKDTRPHAYTRLFDNQWTTAESVFLTPADWDACVDPAWTPALQDTTGGLVSVGVDAATKDDCLAVAGVRLDPEGQTVRLLFHRIWRPRPGVPIDLESSIEAYLREQHARWPMTVRYDPYQLARSMATLKAAGVAVEEFPQTVGNTTRMGTALLDVVRGRNLKLYPADDLRTQALSTVAIENPRGFRIAKERAARKIDAISALAIAVVGALDHPPAVVSPFAPAGGVGAIPRVAHLGPYGQSPFEVRVDANGVAYSLGEPDETVARIDWSREQW